MYFLRLFMITVLVLVSMETTVLARPLMCMGDVCGPYIGYIIVYDVTCNSGAYIGVSRGLDEVCSKMQKVSL